MDAPLNERLNLFTDALRIHAPAYAEAYDELVERLRASRAGSNAPDTGDEMPPFSLPDATCRIYNLAEMLEHGPVVVSINRGHWCEYCRTELDALNRGLSEIVEAGAQVVSIMPETLSFIRQAAEKTQNKFPILSDENNGYAMSLNLVIWAGDRVRGLFLADGLQLEYSHGNASWFLPIPATFVVGTDGRIVARLVDPDFRKRMDIENILNALRVKHN